MRKISEQPVGRPDGPLAWFPRIIGLTKVLGGILFLAMLHHPFHTFGATLPDSYRVTLAWQGSPSPEVTGYRVHYGTASGNYTNSVVVGNVTTGTVSGLASGVAYYFSITAYDTNGVESTFSNEISFIPGLPGIGIDIASTGEVILTLKGLIGHTYDVEATEDFTTWTVIGTATLGANGSLNLTDRSAVSFPKRFYRTRELQP